jgi:outer membrane protein TolC
VALNLSYPLFSGGAKFARRNNALETLSRLQTERGSLVQKIEQRVRSAAHMAGASYAAIKQSHDAAEASLKNLDLVVDSYSQGLLNITQLLDAQNAALVTSEAEANSIYQFLIDLMELERAIGTSYLLHSREKREVFFNRLSDYFERAGVNVR